MVNSLVSVCWWLARIKRSGHAKRVDVAVSQTGVQRTADALAAETGYRARAILQVPLCQSVRQAVSTSPHMASPARRSAANLTPSTSPTPAMKTRDVLGEEGLAFMAPQVPRNISTWQRWVSSVTASVWGG